MKSAGSSSTDCRQGELRLLGIFFCTACLLLCFSLVLVFGNLTHMIVALLFGLAGALVVTGFVVCRRGVETNRRARLLVEAAEAVEQQLELLEEVKLSAKNRLEQCEKHLGVGADINVELSPGVCQAFITCRRITGALEQRFDELSSALETGNPQRILFAWKLSERPLCLRMEECDATGRETVELEPHHWQPTLDTLLCQIESEVKGREQQAVA